MPDSLEYLILQAPCTPLIYHGDSRLRNVFTMQLEHSGPNDAAEKITAVMSYMLHRDMACSEHQMCENL